MGDYTWRLAEELISRGHECQLIAAADWHVQAPSFSTRTFFRESDEGIQLLRLPATLPWSERVPRARKVAEAFVPDWISWQFVLYGFDSRGLGFGLGKNLSEIAGDRRNHMMFHESWAGESAGSTFKERALGLLQRRSVCGVLKKLAPPVLHTHTPLYQLLLRELGAEAKLLPLFGNIPVTPYPRFDWLADKWPEMYPHLSGDERASWWVFVIFGTIHPEWNAADFRQRAIAAAEQAGKRCAFISIGRPGDLAGPTLQQLRADQNDSWRALELGPQSDEDISQCLLTADFGVSPGPPELLSKSGTTAALIEHGLPVIATRESSVYAKYTPEMLVPEMSRIVRDFNLKLVKTEPGSLLPGVAGQFIEDLQRAQ